MQAQQFDIVSREKSNPFGIAAVGDFKLAEKGFIDAQEILANPNILLYCLEPQNQQAVFVEIPDRADVLAAPFYYIGQFEYAARVLKISYETMGQLADQVTLNDQRMILIYSIGRCGTTVTSSAFGEVEDVVSLSEPDVFTQLVQMRDFSGTNEAEISALTRTCLLLTCKDQGQGYKPVWVLKFRSFVMELADIIYAHFPQAKSLFLFRHTAAWSSSIARAFGGNTAPTQEQLIGLWTWLKLLLPRLDRYPLTDLSEIHIGLLLGLMWLNYMECCLERLQAGQAILPVRYEDLKANPEAVINKIFDYCGINGVNMNNLVAVLGQDSQANTPISRDQLKQVDWELSNDDIAIALRVIAEHPIINTPDYQLPGTLKLNLEDKQVPDVTGNSLDVQMQIGEQTVGSPH